MKVFNVLENVNKLSKSNVTVFIQRALAASDDISKYIGNNLSKTLTNGDIKRAIIQLRRGNFDRAMKLLCDGKSIRQMADTLKVSEDSLLKQFRSTSKQVPALKKSIYQAKALRIQKLSPNNKFLQTKNIKNVDDILDDLIFKRNFESRYKLKTSSALLVGATAIAGGMTLVKAHSMAKELMEKNAGCFLNVEGAEKTNECKLKNRSCAYPKTSNVCSSMIDNALVCGSDTLSICKHCACKSGDPLGFPCSANTSVVCNEPSYGEALAEIIDEFFDEVSDTIDSIFDSLKTLWHYIPYVLYIIVAFLVYRFLNNYAIGKMTYSSTYSLNTETTK
jgi:AraC-like DNA-binding protein